MTVKLNCSSSGSVALSAPASTALGADVVLNLPSHAGSLDRLERAGNILQVVYGTTSTSVSNTNTTYVDTTLSTSITPTSASSKILIFINQSYYVTGTTYAFNGLKVFRDAQEIYVPSEAATSVTGSYDFGVSAAGSSSINKYEKANITLLDSPNTTSATTYKTQGRSYGISTVTYQLGGGGDGRGFSTITLMEVAA